MDEEAADELVHCQGHGLIAAGSLDPVILDLEGDAVGIGGDQAEIGDGDAVGIARQVGEHGPESGEGALGIDEPPGLPQRLEEDREGASIGKMGAVSEEA